MADRTAATNSASPASVAQAAAQLGISTLRVRHHLRTGALKGFRDNRGHWQVHIGPIAPVDIAPLQETSLTDLLVDELLEAKDRIEEQAGTIARFGEIVDRQQTMLERSVALLETKLGPESENAARLKASLDRTISLLEQSLARQESVAPQTEKLRGTLERALSALAAATARIEAHDGQTESLGGTLDKFAEIGQRALDRAETAAGEVARVEEMLRRALAVAEANSAGAAQTNNANTERVELALKRRDELIERSLLLIEQAANRVSPASPPSGFFARLAARLGRRG